MLNNVYTVDQFRAANLMQGMAIFPAKPEAIPEAFYNIKVEPGVAMLVEPVNDHAFVFIPPNTVSQFESDPGNGTDKLVCRIQASLFYNLLVEKNKMEKDRVALIEPLQIQETQAPQTSAARRPRI